VGEDLPSIFRPLGINCHHDALRAIAVSGLSDQQVNVEVQGGTTAQLVLPRSNVISAANGFPAIGQGVMVAIRPEQVNLSAGRQEGRSNLVEARLETVLFLGDRYEYTVTLGSDTRVLGSPVSLGLKSGDKVSLDLKPEGVTLWTVSIQGLARVLHADARMISSIP